jgi:hypothetical protein
MIVIVIMSLRVGAGDVSFAQCTLSVHTVRPFLPARGLRMRRRRPFRVRPGLQRLLYSVLWEGAPVAAHAIVQEATLKAARCAQEIHHRLHMYAVGCNKHRRRNAIESLHFASRCVRLATI